MKSVITVCASGELALRVEFTNREFLRRMLKSVIDELNRTPSDKNVIEVFKSFKAIRKTND